MPQTKENKFLEKELHKMVGMEGTKIPDTKFTLMVIRMLKDLSKRKDELSENLNNDILSLANDIEMTKKNQSELKIQYLK